MTARDLEVADQVGLPEARLAALEDACLDWDGTPLVDIEETRWTITVGDVRELLRVYRLYRHRLAHQPPAACELPEVMPGHWDTAEGRALAEVELGRTREQCGLSQKSDFALANAIFMADRSDMDLIVYQTAAKVRIRWLSAQLADANLRLAALSSAPVAPVGEGLREALAKLRFMAEQRTSNEMREEDAENADFDGAYDWFCDQSREVYAALQNDRGEG